MSNDIEAARAFVDAMPEDDPKRAVAQMVVDEMTTRAEMGDSTAAAFLKGFAGSGA